MCNTHFYRHCIISAYLVLVGSGSKSGIHDSQLRWMWHFTCLSVAVFDFLLLPKVGVHPSLCFSYILSVYVCMLAQVYYRSAINLCEYKNMRIDQF